LTGTCCAKKSPPIYPEIGVCGIDIDAAFNKKKDVWVVDLKKKTKSSCGRTWKSAMPKNAWKEGKAVLSEVGVTQLTRKTTKL
jgi:hypothetical protein